MNDLSPATLASIRGGTDAPTSTAGDPDIPNGPDEAAQNQQSVEGDPDIPT